jgi:hypothetical protein
MKRRHSRVFFPLTVGLVIAGLLALYGLMYATVMEPSSHWITDKNGNLYYTHDATYGVGGNGMAYFFGPAHAIDRMLRWSKWKSEFHGRTSPQSP